MQTEITISGTAIEDAEELGPPLTSNVGVENTILTNDNWEFYSPNNQDIRHFDPLSANLVISITDEDGSPYTIGNKNHLESAAKLTGQPMPIGI